MDKQAMQRFQRNQYRIYRRMGKLYKSPQQRRQEKAEKLFEEGVRTFIIILCIGALMSFLSAGMSL